MDQCLQITILGWEFYSVFFSDLCSHCAGLQEIIIRFSWSLPLEVIHFNKSIIFVTEEVVCYAVNDTDEVKMALYTVKYL